MLFTIQDILNTLEQIEVRGKANLDRLLGVIYALEAMAEAEKKAGQIDLPQPTGHTLVEEPTEEGEVNDG